MSDEYEWYDIEGMATVSGMSREEFERLKSEVRDEFPNDQMMFELHLMRAIHALGRNEICEGRTFASAE